jgi:hypothetical protein
MPTPGVVISDIVPRAAPDNGPLTVTVYGAGFHALSSVDYGFGTTTIGTGLIDSNSFVVSLTGSSGPVGLVITSPNLQSAQFDAFFKAYPPVAPTSFTVVLPPVSQGYKMLSLPQYTTVTTLRSALAAALGPYNPVLYRAFFYRGGRYVELNALPDDGCDLAGESFWVLTRNGATLTMSDPDVRRNEAGDAKRVIPINPGFNMVSLPTTNARGAAGRFPGRACR